MVMIRTKQKTYLIEEIEAERYMVMIREANSPPKKPSKFAKSQCPSSHLVYIPGIIIRMIEVKNQIKEKIVLKKKKVSS